jgi:hypothetical protein
MTKDKNPVEEIAIFGVGFGIIIGIGAFFALTKLGNSPELWGLKRNVALGVPLAIISISHLFSGISIFLTKTKWAIMPFHRTSQPWAYTLVIRR